MFADGRTRAYAWGRSVPREELASLVERLLAMSGQFEQRRLARPSFQLDVLDAFVGEEQLGRRGELARAWRAYGAARRRHEALARAAAGAAARVEELRELVARTDGLEPGAEERLRADRERLRHLAELATGAAAAADALAPETGESGAAELAAGARTALAPLAGIASELSEVEREVAESEVRLREAASSLRAFLHSLEAEPGRLEEIEAELDRIADAKRRFGTASYEELLTRAAEARAELEVVEGGADPVGAAEREVAEAGARVEELASGLARERRAALASFEQAVSAALAGLAMGGGEFRVELGERPVGPTGGDEVAFLIRPNAGLPFAPVAQTASGGELSRIALGLRAVAHAGGGEPTVLFDEIDAGIGGETAHAVAEALRALSERAQIVTITHLPQIASVADAHFRVEKVPGDPTHTRIERLSNAERREELERMLGGAEFLATLG